MYAPLDGTSRDMSVPEIPWDDLTVESPVISELAECSRTQNEEGIVACLVRVKRDPKRCQEFIKQTDGLLVLVQFLRCQNHAILNACLSILADACMLSDVREKIKHSRIGHNLTVIIRNPKLNSKMYCRAYRLVGNLSKCSWHAKVLYTAGIVKALEQCLAKSSKINVEWFTHLMAVRAAGNIWSVCVDSREEIIKNEIIKLVATIFTIAEKETNFKLMDECLKALHKFLGTLNYHCGSQMQVDSKNQGYKSLISYCRKSNNIMAIKCLYSLCQIDKCRLNLGIAGAVEQFIDMINSDYMHEEIIYSLCLFCLESVNRDRIKNGGGLQVMLAILEKSKYERFHLILMQAFLQFKFDEDAIEILVKNGILNILAAKLTVAAVAAEKSNKVSKKRSNDYPLEDMGTSFKHYQNKMGRYSMDLFGQDDWSPRSASSSSPPGTPSSSLSPASYIENDDFEDNIYSPICSETESNDNDEDEEASLDSCKSLTIKSLSDKGDFDLAAPLMSCQDCTLLLLITLSRFHTIDGLANPTIITPLLKFIKYTIVNDDAQTIAVKVLKNITKNPECFVPLLRLGLIFEVQSLPDSEEYTKFIVGTITGSAIGHLGFSLLREQEEHKLLTAVSIPLLVKDYHNLYLLLEKHGGLKLIFRLLGESSHKLHERAIWSVCQLAKTLNIYPVDQSIVDESTCSYSTLPNKTDYAKPTVSPTVTFVLDDDSTVEACRQTLCQRSEVFSAMLNGNFSESGKRRVQLKDTSRDGLNTLILAASGTAFEQESIESLLDAVLLADKFLMLDLTKPLIETSISKLNCENFCQAWQWARKNSCHEWRSYCTVSFLTAEMSWGQTMRAFRDFYATDAFDEFLHEVKELIVEKLY